MKYLKFLLTVSLLTTLCLQAHAREGIPNFKKIKNSQARKEAFFQYLLPKVQRINLTIRQERDTLVKLKQIPTLSKTEQDELSQIAKRYKLKTPHTNHEWSRLLDRIDTVPPSMVLAQAANESAWGSSRFAKLGSNLFGQWCYTKGCGIVPKRRSKGQHQEVQVFANVSASIKSYMHNLNTHKSYAYFRKIRAQNRQTQPKLNGSKLAEGLVKYSQRGKAYVREIRAMIIQNHLEAYDT